ncbi:energy-coupling factor transporter transmembrane component T family protein [[Mycoplasma] mobile]|uniref:Putative cobalt ABC transporter permease protein n=1 Tax=Mycoplasma mobile (strain ATCC 43663 / 163K / NCTC 11711) TaxID=267748 RepID=Q6KHL3_MYCM1|nr:energy-coupling factor transporter transmembrane component T [[Mycoplasma] mobile]AAT27917.1 putative cobalt ABC transporter permease protein [Mycoplasma mobile 163K]
MRVTIGRYVEDNTFFHRLDPRVKFIGNILLLVLFFIANDFIVYAFLLIPVIIAFLIATKNPKGLIRIFRLPLYVGIFIFLINMWLVTGESLRGLATAPNNSGLPIGLLASNIYSINYGTWWIFTLSYVSIIRTISIIVRIYALILVTTILTYTTKPVLLTVAIENILYPLKLIRFPVQIISMIISITLRFIPTLLDETSRIMKAQASRGVDFKNGNLKAKVKSTITLIIPLFVSAFAKADDLANAMESRGYDPYKKRMRYRKLSLSWKDAFIIFIYFAFIALIVINTNFPNILPIWWIQAWVNI